MLRNLTFSALAASLVASANAQVNVYVGPSPNLPTLNLDFDNPPVPSGPISSTSPAFTSAGLTSVTLLGTGWTAAGDTTSPGVSNNALQGLLSQSGVLAVGGDTAGTPLDGAGPGDGWEIVFAAPVDEFQCIFTDQVNMDYDIELLAGGTSLAAGSFNYDGGFPNPPRYWRGPGPFDTIRITFPNGSGGVGIDEFAWGNGPEPTPPVNDGCGFATPVTFGSNAIDSTNAKTNGPGSSCGANIADVWYSFTATSAGDYRFETCGSSFDTVMEVYSGSCSSLVSEGCNDDACGAGGSRVDVLGVNAGDTLLIQIGGFLSQRGTGNLEISNASPPVPNCVKTIFASNNGGSVGGAVFFDMTLTQPVSFDGFLTNSGQTSGTPIGASVYTCVGSYVGQEQNAAAWTLVAEDDGTAISLGTDFETPISLAAPFSLPAGLTGIAIVADNFTTGLQYNHRYTNGTGANQNFSSIDGVVTLDLGAGQNTPFTGTPFTPRVWNGELCHSGPSAPGTNYCQAAVNSTGAPAKMSASGSNIVANNDLVLEALDLPPNAFGFFLTSTSQGFVAGPGGSQGNLCLGGAIGRYVGPGQIQNSGAAGTISLAIDNTQVPQPTGSVAIVAGETWNFQLWTRDVSGGGGPPTSNFTDGYEVTFN